MARSALCACGRPLSAEAGDTLIEVVVAAVILVLISVASLSGFEVANRSSADSKRHSQADQLAQQDQDRLRALQVSQLITSLGNQSKTYVLDGTTYTVASSSYFVSDTSGTTSCSTSGRASADYVKTTSTVTWPNMGARKPVVEEGIIAPPAGGSMLVQTTDGGANPPTTPLAGVAIAVTGTGVGTTPSASATTDASGCALFGGLINGNYSMTATDNGYVDPSGNASPTFAETVVAGGTVTQPVVLGKAGSITASYKTYLIGASPPPAAPVTTTTQDTFVAANTGVPAPGYRLFGTNNAFVTSLTTPATVFPFSTAYNAYVGSCSGDDPYVVSGNAVVDPTVTVTPGLTGATPTPGGYLIAPTMAIQPYSGTTGATPMVGYPSQTQTTSAVPDVVTVSDNNCTGNKRVYTPASTPSTVAPTAARGVLSDPGQPYSTYTVCVQYEGETETFNNNGTHKGWKYAPVAATTTTASNKTTTGTTVPIYFGTTPTPNTTCP